MMKMVDDEERELDIESEDEDEDLQDYLVVSSSSGGVSRGVSSVSSSSSTHGHSASSSGSSKGKKRERSGQVLDKRAHHNALERKRRDHIKDSFTGLRDAIPIMAGDKSSRAQILKKASDYICYMRKKTQSHSEDIDDLKRQNMHLEEQIRALERAKNMGGHLASSDVVLANAGLQPLPSNHHAAASEGDSGLVVNIPSESNLIATSKISSSSSSSSQSSRRIIVPGQSLLIPKDNSSKEKVKLQL